MEEIKKGKLLQIDGRGKNKVAMTGVLSMLKLWALQNTRGKSKTYVSDEKGKVLLICSGNGGNNFPTIQKESEIPENLYITEKEV